MRQLMGGTASSPKPSWPASAALDRYSTRPPEHTERTTRESPGRAL